MTSTDGIRAFVKVRGKDAYRSRTEAEIAALRRRSKPKKVMLKVIVPANDP